MAYRELGKRDEGPRLGAVVSVHRADPATLALHLAGVALPCVPAVLLLRADRALPPWIVVVFALLAAVVAWSVFAMTRYLFVTLKVREHALVYRNRGAKRVVRWDRIREVSVDARTVYLYGVVPIRRTVRYHLDLETGERLTFGTGLRAVDAAGDRIAEEVAARALPKALARIAAGKTAQFGDFGVSAEGLWNGSALLRWEDFDRAEIAAGALHVYRRAPKPKLFFSAVSRHVPNGRVLARLVAMGPNVARIAREAHPEAAP